MKIELKEIITYLPYGLKLYDIGTSKVIAEMDIGNFEFVFRNIKENDSLIKPILRPLLDLFNGNYESILDEFSEVSLESFKIAFLSELRPLNALDNINYTTAIKLFEKHFDIFGLIDKGLAININTLDEKI